MAFGIFGIPGFAIKFRPAEYEMRDIVVNVGPSDRDFVYPSFPEIMVFLYVCTWDMNWMGGFAGV